ncbi:heavy metal translocating P-type ATPase [Fundidesulfovibrio terrae]|uniref:heavy metal translocating P-type ATPase n=1 Tax=Fundidesulfovibrio terrae TaxID=2922866 RepID=UPI001FB0173C|nr:heavy metal translocating P-type ATPase [Fundidesulfovibrio terrae]
MNAPDKMTFSVPEMDCMEEAALLKRALAPLVQDEDRLDFDFIGRRMTVNLDGLDVSRERILAAVASTGLAASEQSGTGGGMLDGCSCCGGSCSTGSQKQSYLRRNRRAIACAASGTAWIAGLVTAAVAGGSFLAAFREGANAPAASMAFWLFAALAGMWHVLPRAWASLKTLRPDMNLLMVAAAVGAMALGDYSEGASVAFLFALANELESWSMGRARRAIQSLADITPATALVLEPLMLTPVQKRVEEVAVGATVLVRPGDKVPLDGVVRKGASAVDQSPITGESMPVPKGPGDAVYAGTINAEGALEVETTRPASDTTLARIMHMVEAAQSRRAKAVQWVDRFAVVYTPAMIGLSLLVAVIPPLLFGGAWAQWFYQALVVLVISCPCALVISTPVSVVAALASAARNGVLVKGGAYLEAPASVTAVALDKTGTLTLGRPSVTAMEAFGKVSARELLAAAAALESRSSHPLAGAVLAHARRESVEPPVVEDARAIPGLGAQGLIGGVLHFVGNARLLREQSPALLTPELAGRFEKCAGEAAAAVAVWNESGVLGILTIEDKVRPEAPAAVAELLKLGVERVVMLTGDNEAAAQTMARRTGVTGYEADLLPQDKTRIVSEMAEGGVKVAMVGDGVNDAPALAASNLGVAMGSIGTGVAIETADVALMSDDLSKLPWLIRHSRRTLGTIKCNIGFALGLKALFLAMAFLQLATLWMAILADMGASLIVIFNGLRLLRIRK